jgi:hypothetical protein
MQEERRRGGGGEVGETREVGDVREVGEIREVGEVGDVRDAGDAGDVGGGFARGGLPCESLSFSGMGSRAGLQWWGTCLDRRDAVHTVDGGFGSRTSCRLARTEPRPACREPRRCAEATERPNPVVGLPTKSRLQLGAARPSPFVRETRFVLRSGTEEPARVDVFDVGSDRAVTGWAGHFKITTL